MPPTHSIRRQCPKCNGYFYLDHGVATCPHCNTVVEAPKGSNKSISSMRAATRSGYTFVGPSMSSGVGSANKSSGHEYKSNFTAPDKERQRAKQHLQEVLKEKKGFWQEELQQALGEFGGMSIGASLLKLAEEMGIELDQGE